MLFASKPPAYSEPGHCLILPAKRSDPEGGVQLQTQIEGLRGPLTLWLSYTGLRQLAEKHPRLGLVPREKLAKAEEERDLLETLLAASEAKVEQLEADAERIIGLRRAGYVVQKANGRPPKAGVKS